MSGFLGRETLMPSAARRGKRGRKQEKVATPAPDFDADSESSSSEEENHPPKKKKIKSPTKARKASSSSSPERSPSKTKQSSKKRFSSLSSPEPPPQKKSKETPSLSNHSPSKKNTPLKKIPSSSSSSSSASSDSSSSEDGEQEPATKVKPGSAGNWCVEDLEHLTAVVLKSLPPHDTIKYTKRLEKMNWEQIKFGVYSAEDCKKQWVHMYTKVRTHRTMAELASDVKELVMNNKGNFEFRDKNGRLTHPDMPKKPQTAYFRFIADKREYYKKKQPGLSHIELTKILAKRFNELSDAKKKKYIDAYNEGMKVYKVAYEKFQADHPELFVPKSKSKSIFTRPMSAMQIFINRRMEENLLENPEANRKELHDALKEKWVKMSAARKDKYVRKAIEDKIRLEHDLDEYCKVHPDFDASTVKKMYDRTKVEKEILDKASGKPAPPPRNAYMYFVSDHLSEPAAGQTSKERMADIRTKWKNLNAAAKAKYASLFEKRVKEYEREYAAWKESLSPGDREKVEAEEAAAAPKKVKKEPIRVPVLPPATPSTQTTITQTLHRKPISAMLLYIDEKKENYKKKHPKLSALEVTKALSKKYEDLSDEKKQKYKKLELEQRKLEKEKLMKNGVPASRASPTPGAKKAKRKPFPGEPKKAPANGYSLFSCELLQGKQLADVPSSQRMSAISQKWKELSDAEREKFKAKSEKMVAKYKKELEKFRNSLSPEDRTKFDESHPPNSKSKSAKAVKVVATQKPQEDSDGSDDSSSSSDSEEEVPKVKSPSKLATQNVRGVVVKQLSQESDSSSSSSSSDEESGVNSPRAKTMQVATPKIASKQTSDSSEDSDSSSLASGPPRTIVNTVVNTKLSSSGSDSDSD